MERTDGDANIYRVFGGNATLDGRSWTPVDPRGLDNARARLGLPATNAGRYLAVARVKDWSGVSCRRALPYGNYPGGEVEYLVPSPASQLEILETLTLEPPY